MLLDDILFNLKNYSNDIAYMNKDKQITYFELYQRIKAIYSNLRRFRLTDTPIVIYGHKQELMIASFLACAFLGIPYVPLDEGMSIERCKDVIDETKPQLVINISNDCLENPYGMSIKNNMVMDWMKNLSIYEDVERVNMLPSSTYYIIFTSGSTGIPKGVKIAYSNLDSFINWLKSMINVRKSCILNQAPFSFDLSVADVYLSLSTASKLVVTDMDMFKEAQKLFEYIGKSNVEVAVMTPTFAELLMTNKKFQSTLVTKLHTMYFCGETLTPMTVKRLKERFNRIRIINSYGPTETTVAVTAIDIDESMLILEKLPIGRVKNDTFIDIVDSKTTELSDGQTGEIVIYGDSVGQGYINIESKNFFKYKKLNAYKTGDIGYKQNGIIWYGGRKDSQIKYKGYRIELNDIESNIYKLPYIKKAKVVAMFNDDKVIKLVGYVSVEEENKLISPQKIQEDLLRYIPGYMCPSIKIIDNIDININGKFIVNNGGD